MALHHCCCDSMFLWWLAWAVGWLLDSNNFWWLDARWCHYFWQLWVPDRNVTLSFPKKKSSLAKICRNPTNVLGQQNEWWRIQGGFSSRTLPFQATPCLGQVIIHTDIIMITMTFGDVIDRSPLDRRWLLTKTPDSGVFHLLISLVDSDFFENRILKDFSVEPT